MLFKKSLFSSLLVAILFISFAGCNSKPNETANNPSMNEESIESDVSPIEESEDSVSTEPEVGLKTDTVGNINFTYRDTLEVKEIEGVKYIYYNDSAFFYVDSAPITLENDVLDEAGASEFFTASEMSFNQGDWKNGKMVTDISNGNFNGVEVWICEIEMEHTSGMQFSNSTAVMYLDGVLTSFTLISDIESYQTSAVEFADTLTSLSAV